MTQLNDKIIAGLEPGKIHWFTGAKASNREAPSGFGVRISGNTRTFVFRYELSGGKQRLQKIGRHPAWSVTKAINEAIELRRRIDRGGDPLGEKRQAAAKVEADEQNKLEKVCERYFANCPADMRSKDKKKADVERLVYPVFGDRDIAAVKRTEINGMLNDIHADSGPQMADKIFGHLRSILNWHATQADDYNSPIVRGMRPKTKSQRDRDLIDAEIVAMWRTGEGSPYGAMLKFILLTGCRPSEASMLPWSEIDGNGVWVLPAARNKTKVKLARPLSDAALRVLPPRTGKYVFSLDGGVTPIGRTNLTRLHVALLEDSGTAGWVRHDLRRTSRTLMARAGVSDEHAEQCLGHLIGGVKAVYNVHKYFNEKKQAYEQLVNLINSIINPTPGLRIAA